MALLFLLALCGLETPSPAAIPLPLDNPTGFFTNLATRLLKTELNLDLNNLQVHPTNFYTPSVHRLLQVTANIYDCTTNRGLGITPEEPYCPSVFRPIFRRIDIGSNAIVVIAGYRELTNTDLADPISAPAMYDLSQPGSSLQAFAPYGTPFMWPEGSEPMVSGIPLVIGARKGFPNFNEFSMQTQVLVSRLLEFRRAPADSNGPVVETNQMYAVGVSDNFGLEAWNSYLTAFPRELQLTATAYMQAVITNELAEAVFSNSTIQSASLVIGSNAWNGWSTVSTLPASMVLPFGSTNGFTFLTNSTYINQPPFFEPQTHTFTRGTGFYVPHWWLNLKTRVLFTLVDTAANRIVDYVNLNRAERTVDITYTLANGVVSNPADYRNPANQWLTNRMGPSTSWSAPTYGIINQIAIGLNGTADWLNFSQDPYAGLDANRATDNFRYNFGFSPIYPQDFGLAFYKSNVFYAPFDPIRSVYVHTSLQANDPLVHYLVDDLSDWSVETNRVNVLSLPSNLGYINGRYAPWGGNPFHPDPALDLWVALKDPGVTRSDDWNFPTNQPLRIDWIGAVHRGTPWQTVYLKSTNLLLTAPQPSGVLNWARWTGNAVLRPDWFQPGCPVPDALFTTPTNDWHLVSLLNTFFNTNASHNLTSPNLATVSTWEALLDGMTVFTNSGPGELTLVIISSNSPQAAFVAAGLLNSRASEPDQLFKTSGAVLATPELSVESPFLDPATFSRVTDAALEAIPSQLLGLLRSDSIASFETASGTNVIRFTGIDGNSYIIQTSADLINWSAVSTNSPENGVFDFSPDVSSLGRFYRSALGP